MSVPAVLPVLALVAGISAGVFARTGPGLSLVAAIVCWGAALAAWHAGRPRALSAAALAGFAAVGVALGGAEARGALNPPLLAFYNDYQERRLDWPLVVEGRLREDAAPGDFGVSLTINVERVQTPCAWVPARGAARLSVSGALATQQRERWRAGRRIRAAATLRRPSGYRNPGAGDEDLALARRGLSLIGSVKSAALVEVVAQGHALAEAASAAREGTRQAIAATLPDRPIAAAIVTAILIGDRGGLPPEVQRRLQAAGTYHVIAISGGNIAILAGLCFVLLSAARVPPRAASIVLTVLLCAYGYLAGGGPSVARATIAAVIYLLARAADHRTPAVNALAVVALIAVVREPLEVFDPGLWLSYGATLAILIGADRVLKRRRHRGPFAALPIVAALAAILVGTIAAELALFPVGAYVFQRVTVAGIVLNFIAIPLMTVVQIAGMAAVALFWSIPALAGMAARIAGLAAAGLVESTRLVDLAPWLTWRVPAPPVWLMAAYYGGWILLYFSAPFSAAAVRQSRMRSARTPFAMLIALAGICIAAPVQIPGLTVVARPPRDALRITFLDVGQGDAVLIELAGGRTLLVDAAGQPGSSTFDLGERVIGPALLSFGVRRLDYLAITHGDPDHAGGAMAIARDFRPRELWEGVPVPPHPTLRALSEHLAGRGAVLRTVRPDDRLRLGGVELRVLHPPEPEWERQRVRNDDSIVIELQYGEVSIVLPGDIGAEVERALAGRLAPARLRVLKAAHHGSATSTSAEWLGALAPAAVVFSCGRGNRYGHPAPPVLARVRASGAEVFRTDEDGAITLTTDGHEVAVSTFSGRVSRINREGHKGREAREGGR